MTKKKQTRVPCHNHKYAKYEASVNGVQTTRDQIAGSTKFDFVFYCELRNPNFKIKTRFPNRK